MFLTETLAGTGTGKRKHDDDITQQLNSDIETMERKFVHLQLSTRESLKKRNIPYKKLVDFLRNYRCFRSAMTNEQLQLLGQQSDLKKAESIDEVFCIVSPFWSFIDYRILEDIISSEDLGDDSDRQNLTAYITDLKEFLNSWKVEPHEIYRHKSERLESRVKLRLKLNTDTLSMYRDVKAAIARIFMLRVEELQLYSIEEGCIELAFLCLGITELPPLSFEKEEDLYRASPPILKVMLVDEHGIETALFEVGVWCAHCGYH